MLNAVFVGGGSVRLLPLLRQVCMNPAVFDGGSIRLVDRKLDRAEAVGRLLLRCPEFAKLKCSVLWSTDFVRQLEGADVVYLTMAARREPTWTQSLMLSEQYGYIGSDQLSINGAFLSARLGKTIMAFARQMEHHAPQARLLIFPNPVAAYAAGVERHTRIQALGICNGYTNHIWDLTRLCFRKDAPDYGWEPVIAGVNHLSFILRGTYHGTPIRDLLAAAAAPDWTPPEIPSLRGCYPNAELKCQTGLRVLMETFRAFGTPVFSSETDGSMHIGRSVWEKFCPEEPLEKRMNEFDPVKAETEQQGEFEKNFRYLREAAADNRVPDWNHSLLRPCKDISVDILTALAGQHKARVAASRLNRGAIRGIPDDNVVEYSMDLDGKNVTPCPDLYIPHPFQGLISSLAEFHTLLGDFAATLDPRLFAQALEAYPMHQFEPSRKAFIHDMFNLYSDLDPEFRLAEQYLNG